MKSKSLASRKLNPSTSLSIITSDSLIPNLILDQHNGVSSLHVNEAYHYVVAGRTEFHETCRLLRQYQISVCGSHLILLEKERDLVLSRSSFHFLNAGNISKRYCAVLLLDSPDPPERPPLLPSPRSRSETSVLRGPMDHHQRLRYHQLRNAVA